jgi:hypothetical protein
MTIKIIKEITYVAYGKKYRSARGAAEWAADCMVHSRRGIAHEYTGAALKAGQVGGLAKLIAKQDKLYRNWDKRMPKKEREAIDEKVRRLTLKINHYEYAMQQRAARRIEKILNKAVKGVK